MKNLMQKVVLSTLWVCLAASIGYAQCNPQVGHGVNSRCLNGNGCATSCGDTVAWCITVICSNQSICGIGENSNYIECRVGGCGDIITMSYCTSCSA